MTGAENECKFEPAKDTPYHALPGELGGVFCDDFRENQRRYIITALHCTCNSFPKLPKI